MAARNASAVRFAAPAVDRILGGDCKREAEEGAGGQYGQQQTAVGKGETGKWLAARNHFNPRQDRRLSDQFPKSANRHEQ